MKYFESFYKLKKKIGPKNIIKYIVIPSLVSLIIGLLTGHYFIQLACKFQKNNSQSYILLKEDLGGNESILPMQKIVLIRRNIKKTLGDGILFSDEKGIFSITGKSGQSILFLDCPTCGLTDTLDFIIYNDNKEYTGTFVVDYSQLENSSPTELKIYEK